MPTVRRIRRAPRSAFTLMELLIVITIIAVLGSMVLATSVMIKEKAKELATKSRMQAILNALTTYGGNQGSTCLKLQSNLGLGGVATFDTYKVIVGSVPAASALPTPFRSWNGKNYNVNGVGVAAGWRAVTPAMIAMRTPGEQVTAAPSFAPATGALPEERTLYSRLASSVFDVMPPTTAAVPAGFYATTWPLQWPETDWFLGAPTPLAIGGAPGTVPPILRYPWGKPGLRIDGSLCDPAVAAGLPATPEVFAEKITSAGTFLAATEQIANSWACNGDANGNIWKWTSQNAAQTDYVSGYGVMRRSNGAAAAAPQTNQAIPFDLGYLSPLETIDFLMAAAIISDPEDYRNNRKPSVAWNDAWGHPLVVSYALFQPERYTRAFDGENRRDLLLRGCTAAYQYNRSIYLAVGAPGPNIGVVPATWAAAADATTLRDYYSWICNVTEAYKWDETAFTAPPWKGEKVRKIGTGGFSFKCMITSPIEVK